MGFFSPRPISWVIKQLFKGGVATSSPNEAQVLLKFKRLAISLMEKVGQNHTMMLLCLLKRISPCLVLYGCMVVLMPAETKRM